MENKPAQNIQDSFLNTARKEKINVTIYLLSGVKLTGRIRSFDKYSVVLENQLLLIVGFKDDRVFVKRANSARKFYTAHQINSDTAALFPRGVEEGVLNVLRRRLGFHLPISLYPVRPTSKLLVRLMIAQTA